MKNFFIKNYCNTSPNNAHTNSNSQYPTCTIQTRLSFKQPELVECLLRCPIDAKARELKGKSS